MSVYRWETNFNAWVELRILVEVNVFFRCHVILSACRPEITNITFGKMRIFCGWRRGSNFSSLAVRGVAQTANID